MNKEYIELLILQEHNDKNYEEEEILKKILEELENETNRQNRKINKSRYKKDL